MNPAPRYAHVQAIRKRGREYLYFRRGDLRIALPGPYGSPAFVAAYAKALATPAAPIGASKALPGSCAALAAAWYQDRSFCDLAPSTQAKYRRLLEAWLKAAGDRLVRQIEPRHIEASLLKRQATPAQANALLVVLKSMLRFARVKGWRRDNPAADISEIKHEAKPFETWSDDDIAAFEARWPMGTRARLALALMLYTGQRRSDIIRMGPKDVRAGCIAVKQQKTGKALSLPIHPDLQEAIDAYAASGQVVGFEAFLVTVHGQPFASTTGFYNWFTDCCRAAGVQKPPHGLRKATVCRLWGRVPIEAIQAITGQSRKMVEHYAADVRKDALAAQAMAHLGRPRND